MPFEIGISYMWDFIIEQFTGHFMSGTSEYMSNVATSAPDIEEILRFFARENRVRRRTLAGALKEMNETTSKEKTRLRVLTPWKNGQPYWVLLLFPFAGEMGFYVDPNEYRKVRREYLTCCLKVVRLLHPDAVDIVGFATETALGLHGSEDALYYDARTWTEADEKDALEIQRNLKILTRPKKIETTEREYPV